MSFPRENLSSLSFLRQDLEEVHSTKETKVVIACAVKIIKINKDEEDEEKLVQEKVKELQILFQNESLDKLKDMSFIQDEQFEDTTGVRLADEGDGEGQEGDSDQQIEID